MPLIAFDKFQPSVDPSVFVAPTAWLTGQVSVGEASSFFFGAIARGDVYPIVVGARTNIQDHAMLHSSHGLGPCTVGDDVTVGHSAIIHGCTIHNRCIIGMGAVVLDNAEIGEDCIVGANSLVTMGTKIPPRSMAFGSPAKVVRSLTEDEVADIIRSARSYQATAASYRESFREAHE